MSRSARILIYVVATITCAAAGALVAILLLMPSANDVCNERVANAVVPHAGISPDARPGPRTNLPTATASAAP